MTPVSSDAPPSNDTIQQSSSTDGSGCATPFMGRDKRLLIAESDTQFLSAEGLAYQFVRDQNGFVTHLVEIHVSGNYPYKRQR
jgi:hypothetical protein